MEGTNKTVVRVLFYSVEELWWLSPHHHSSFILRVYQFIKLVFSMVSARRGAFSLVPDKADLAGCSLTARVSSLRRHNQIRGTDGAERATTSEGAACSVGNGGAACCPAS